MQCNLLSSKLRNNFTKTQERLEKAIQSGRFESWTSAKKNAVLRRIQRYARKLNFGLKPSLLAALTIAGCIFSNSLKAQSYSLVSGPSSPFFLKIVLTDSKPAFADIDNDGDYDLFAGQNGVYNGIPKFTNTGTLGLPSFGISTDLLSMFFRTSVALVDLDNDGDKDMIIANDDGFLREIFYYRNTGTAASAVFTAQTGGANPFNAFTGIQFPSVAFTDIDNDGDLDMAVGESAGTIRFYRNTGTASSPSFTQITGVSSPFNGIDAGINSAPSFSDIDLDGDKDLVVGESTGTMLYYQNTGTAASATFTQQTGALNPFNGFDVGSNASPAFVDINNDTRIDLVVGTSLGDFVYYTNTASVLPLQWLDFTAQKSSASVLLNWSVAAERNTLDFVIQHSTNGVSYVPIGSVKAAGNSTAVEAYSFKHHSPVAGANYYRLQQRDADGRSSFSEIRTVRLDKKEGNFSLVTNAVTNGVLQVNVNGAKTLLLLNTHGQLLQKFNVTNGVNQLALSNYPKGVYYLNGNEKTERFIIQ